MLSDKFHFRFYYSTNTSTVQDAQIKTALVLKPSKYKKKTSLDLVRERTIPTERPPIVGKIVPTFADRGCWVVSATDPPVVNLFFFYRSRYYFFQVAPQLSSRG
jgi:hypothetical protein